MKRPSSNSGVTPQASAGGNQSRVQSLPGLHHIELNISDVNQLFNTMDPSPFHEKDLDHDAEEFIVSWAQEFNVHEPVDLIIHVKDFLERGDTERMVKDAIHNYFSYRARLNDLEFKRLMKQGRLSLGVGLTFLVICLLVIEFLRVRIGNAMPGFLKEGLIIVGWVAMWKPLEIYLYEWWPLRRKGRIYAKLSRMPVAVKKLA